MAFQTSFTEKLRYLINDITMMIATVLPDALHAILKNPLSQKVFR